MTRASFSRLATGRRDPASPDFPLPRAPVGAVFSAEAAEATRAWFDLARRRYQNSWRGLLIMARCRTPQDFIAARADLLCEDLDLIRSGCAGLSETIADAAGEAVRVIETGPTAAS